MVLKSSWEDKNHNSYVARRIGVGHTGFRGMKRSKRDAE